MTEEEYKKSFADPPREGEALKEADTRAGRALALALDIRKFEIDLYWKRATYFWSFIAAAFAGYALTYKTANELEPWLTLVFSALGLVFSFAWYLANRGSKFWQQNWERHVDLLEDLSLGPLYKVIATAPDERNLLTAAGQFSVTKINQILSAFVTLIWVVLYVRSLMPISTDLKADYFKIAVTVCAVAMLFLLWRYGRSKISESPAKLTARKYHVVP